MLDYDNLKNLKIELPKKIDENGHIIREGIDGNYAVISINRPDRLNAITFQTIKEIEDVLRMLEIDSDVRCVVLRGVKEYTKKPSFSTGQDLGSAYPPELKPNIPMHMSQFIRIYHRTFDEIEQFSKPLIAAVDGFALGGGTEMALLCDIVIASKRSIFGLTEISRGIIPAGGGTQRLAKRIGVNRALRVLFFGEKLPAEILYKWGLVSFIPDNEEFENIVHEKAKWLGAAPTSALFVIKKCIKFGTRHEQLGLIMEKLGFALNSSSKDKEEGINAFLEKRDSVFKGH